MASEPGQLGEKMLERFRERKRRIRKYRLVSRLAWASAVALSVTLAADNLVATPAWVERLIFVLIGSTVLAFLAVMTLLMIDGRRFTAGRKNFLSVCPGCQDHLSPRHDHCEECGFGKELGLLMSEEWPVEPVDERDRWHDHALTDTDSAENLSSEPGEASGGVVDAGVKTVASVFRAAFIMIAAVALVVAVFIGVALFPNIEFDVLGDVIVVSGISFLVSLVLPSCFLVASTIVLFLVHPSDPVVSEKTQDASLDGTSQSSEGTVWTVLVAFSCLAGGIGASIVCDRLGGVDRFWEFSGLVIAMLVFWSVVLWRESGVHEPTADPSRFMRRICAAATNVLGASLGGVAQFLLASRFDN